MCACWVYSGAWALLIDWVGGVPQGTEASLAQILQFSPHAEKRMIKAQLTCLKSPGERRRNSSIRRPSVVTAS